MSALASAFRQDYAYGYGRIGVLQEYLLSQGDVERLLNAKGEADLSRALTELKISSHVEFNSNPHRFINNLEQWLKREVISLVPKDECRLFDILWLKNDASFLAYLLKKHHGFTSDLSTEPHVGATAYDTADLRSLVNTGKVGTDVPDALVQFVLSRRGTRPASPQDIDTAVAQFTVDMQMTLAERSGSHAIEEYVAHHIDLQNIRTARRLSKDEVPEDHLQRGGHIDVEHFSTDPDRLVTLVQESSLPSGLLEDLLTATDPETSSVLLERGLAKAIAHDIGAMRNHVLTIEPIFAFASIAQSQLRLLRTILVGKAAGLSPDETRKLLPPFLSASPFAS
jgi:vacuolar-type H+-ATPase subunit C/Vma6